LQHILLLSLIITKRPRDLRHQSFQLAVPHPTNGIQVTELLENLLLVIKLAPHLTLQFCQERSTQQNPIITHFRILLGQSASERQVEANFTPGLPLGLVLQHAEPGLFIKTKCLECISHNRVYLGLADLGCNSGLLGTAHHSGRHKKKGANSSSDEKAQIGKPLAKKRRVQPECTHFGTNLLHLAPLTSQKTESGPNTFKPNSTEGILTRKPETLSPASMARNAAATDAFRCVRKMVRQADILCSATPDSCPAPSCRCCLCHPLLSKTKHPKGPKVELSQPLPLTNVLSVLVPQQS